jgi:TRAP-type C4-dicarboxylate transport system permease small subunit
VFFLFLQWPLRDIVRGWSTEANDPAQIVFAFYVAVAFSAVTRAGTHLAADTLARRYSAAARRRITQIVTAFAILPWGVLLPVTGYGMIVTALQLVEIFRETRNPGHFMIKLAVGLMALMVIARSLIDIARPQRQGAR